MFQNIVIGKPLVDIKELLALDERDWEENEKANTLFLPDTRFLPAIMKEVGIVKSTSEIRRNRPDLWINLNTPTCMNIKWGKRFLYIVVGE